MWAKNCVISPNKFLKTLRHVADITNNNMFAGNSQNDVCEFIMFMIDGFHTAMVQQPSRNATAPVSNDDDDDDDKMDVLVICDTFARSQKSSKISNIFNGIVVSEITSLETHESLSVTPDTYFIVNLSIPTNIAKPTIYDCFDVFCQKETLDGENAWFSEKHSKKINISKQLLFWSFPQVLVIDIKRVGHGARTRKNNIIVEFPIINFDLTKYTIDRGAAGAAGAGAEHRRQELYDLFGVCNHYGGFGGGHYTCVVKTASMKWFCFNDMMVTQVTSKDAIVTPNAYCLFYRKKTC